VKAYHQTSVTPPLFIDVPLPRQEIHLSCIFITGIPIVPLSNFIYLRIVYEKYFVYLKITLIYVVHIV